LCGLGATLAPADAQRIDLVGRAESHQGTGVHTHWVEGGVPRRPQLPLQRAGKAAAVSLPTDVNTLPVGHYMLFGMVDDIPSVAKIVRIRN
jgi:hypothetical protein